MTNTNHLLTDERDERADAADAAKGRVRELENKLANMTGARDHWKAKYEGIAPYAPVLAHDGQSIEVGQTLYGLSDGNAWTVTGIAHGRKHPVLAECRDALPMEVEERALKPEWLTHEQPDSLERIAYDLRKLSMNFSADVYKRDECEYVDGIAERIEKLAKEGA